MSEHSFKLGQKFGYTADQMRMAMGIEAELYPLEGSDEATDEQIASELARLFPDAKKPKVDKAAK